MGSRKLEGAIRKVALGYSLKEVTEEYSVENGEMKLTKRKETRKDIPPDLKAVKLLLEDDDPVSEWSDEKLAEEKARLLAVIKKEEEKTNKKEGEEKSDQ